MAAMITPRIRPTSFWRRQPRGDLFVQEQRHAKLGGLIANLAAMGELIDFAAIAAQVDAACPRAGCSKGAKQPEPSNTATLVTSPRLRSPKLRYEKCPKVTAWMWWRCTPTRWLLRKAADADDELGNDPPMLGGGARLALAAALLAAGKMDEAEREIQEALRLNGPSAWTHLALAQLAERRGLRDEAGRHAGLARAAWQVAEGAELPRL